MIKLVEAFEEHKSVIKILEESSVIKGPCSLHCDNQTDVKIARDTGYSGQARHVELRFFPIQDFVSHQEITLRFCPYEKNFANTKTKSLVQNKHMQA